MLPLTDVTWHSTRPHSIVEDVLMDTEYSLINKAQSFGQKIWTLTKLSSVVDRCLATPSTGQSQSLTTSVSATTQQSLSRLLQSERLNGTCERDPSERRHDFRYFSKDSYFVLVEDLHQEFATIAAHEYPVRNRIARLSRCGRSCIVTLMLEERRRWEKTQQAESAKEKQALHVPRTGRPRARPTSLHLQATGHGDLRRSVSMNNIRRRASHPNGVLRDANLVDLDADEYDNDLAYASGYLASGISGHAAASGNSVGLTSTAGTTSTTGTVRNALQLTATLRGRLQQHVVTSKSFLTEKGRAATDLWPS
ncbi:Dfp1/Him1, central region-domain-containing protein [Salix suchowensis]|nr:Dfp1/Him1, central region-domain-containing protein [Salix suchowensis]